VYSDLAGSRAPACPVCRSHAAGNGESHRSFYVGDFLWHFANAITFDTMAYGGATIVNDAVFTGGLDGVVRGLKVADGSPVFTYQTNAGINTSFAISGDYLFVAAGAPLIAPQGSAPPAPATAQPALIALKLQS